MERSLDDIKIRLEPLCPVEVSTNCHATGAGIGISPFNISKDCLTQMAELHERAVTRCIDQLSQQVKRFYCANLEWMS